jgi:hypothetical protein
VRGPHLLEPLREVGALSREVEADHRMLAEAVRLRLMQDRELRAEVGS